VRCCQPYAHTLAFIPLAIDSAAAVLRAEGRWRVAGHFSDTRFPPAGPTLRLPDLTRPGGAQNGNPSFVTISPRWRCTLPPGNHAATRGYLGDIFFSTSSPSAAVTAG